jgi:hypothetical protein
MELALCDIVSMRRFRRQCIIAAGSCKSGIASREFFTLYQYGSAPPKTDFI